MGALEDLKADHDAGFAICVTVALFAVGASAADTDAVVPEELVQALDEAAAVKNCELVVEDCFATPSFPSAPAWTAPTATFSKNYNALCSDEAAVKAQHEKAEKIEAAQKKEVAAKGMAAERASKYTERKAKEAQMKMEKSAKINEKATKEASKKNTEKEEKLFNSERLGKESSTKKASEIASKTTIVPSVPPPPPIIPVPVPAPIVTPIPVPSAPAPPALQYACDVHKCQCVVASNGPYNELPYCNEMCASVPQCTPVLQPPLLHHS